MTKAELNTRLATPLTASKLKKTSLADLQAIVDAEKPKACKARALPDRVMIEPGKPEDVKATKAGSKRHLMAEALAKGATIEELMETLGWTKDTVSSAFRVDSHLVVTRATTRRASAPPFEGACGVSEIVSGVCRVEIWVVVMGGHRMHLSPQRG